MKTIYIGSDFKCHVSNDGTMAAVETDFFDGKCDAFIEGYRFIPSGESWTRSDGVVFHKNGCGSGESRKTGTEGARQRKRLNLSGKRTEWVFL